MKTLETQLLLATAHLIAHDSDWNIAQQIDDSIRRAKNRKAGAKPYRAKSASVELLEYYGVGYVNGKTRNKSCLCGSGKKLKNCCANRFGIERV